MFAHITVFISFIYAVAVTQVLTSVSDLILARDRVRWSGLALGWMLAAVLLLCVNWLVLFRLAGIREWTGTDVLIRLAAALVLYFTCALSAVRVPAAGPVDMAAYFDRHRRAIIGAFLAFNVVAVLASLSDLLVVGLSAQAAFARVKAILVSTPVFVVALLLRNIWIQRAALAFIVGRLVYVLASFSGVAFAG